jgi:hypothetical protein
MPDCVSCGEEADEWYNDHWMCLSCITKLDEINDDGDVEVAL